MLRKYLFWGLTIALGASLFWMVVAGRRQEKLEQKKPRPVEIVQTSKPSATRMYMPADLRIVSMLMEPASPDDRSAIGAKHSIEVRNTGSVPYTNLLVEISYFSSSGKPGRFSGKIIYADLDSAGSGGT